MVVLVSSDGKDFTIERDVAEHLTLINGPQLEESNQPIPLPAIESAILEKVLEYCEHHRGEILEENQRSEWDLNFIAGVDSDALNSIIRAANYLGMVPLLNLGCNRVADMLKGKTPEEIHNMLNPGTPFVSMPSVQATPI